MQPPKKDTAWAERSAADEGPVTPTPFILKGGGSYTPLGCFSTAARVLWPHLTPIAGKPAA